MTKLTTPEGREIRLETKNDALAHVLGEIDKRFGVGTMKWASDITAVDLDYISTGSYALDWAMGGGFPRKKITTVYGDYSVGKSTICLHGCATVQAADKPASFMKMENWLPPEYAKAIGVDMSKLLLIQSSKENQVSGEQVLTIAESLMRSGDVPIVVIDSIPALIPHSQIESDIGDKDYAAIAGLLSRTLKKLHDAAEYGNSALVFTSQERQTIGAMAFHGYQPVHMYGGRAIRFWSDIIVKLSRKLETETRKEKQITKAIVEKNRLSVPQREAHFVIEYGKGIDKMEDLVSFAVDRGVIEKSGSWYKFKQNKWQGTDAVAKSLKEQPELLKELEGSVKNG